MCGQCELDQGHLHRLNGASVGPEFSRLLHQPASGMRACLVLLCLLAATAVLSVKGKSRGKHHGLHKTPHAAREKDVIPEENNKPHASPTLVTPEARSQEQEDESSSEGNADSNKENDKSEATDMIDKSSAVLLSEQELIDLLKKGAADEGMESTELEKIEMEKVRFSDAAADDVERKEKKEADEMEVKEDGEDEQVEKMLIKDEEKVAKVEDSDEQLTLLDDTDGSTESEIPMDLDSAAERSILQPLLIFPSKIDPHTDESQPPSKTDIKDVSEKEPLSLDEDYEQDMQRTEAAHSEEVSDQDTLSEPKDEKDSQAEPKDWDKDVKPRREPSGLQVTGKEEKEEEERSKNDSANHPQGKSRRQKKNRRARKHSPQGEEAQTEQDLKQHDAQESESSSSNNTMHKAKRRRAGKRGAVVGMNPVQIRATVDLYPSSRPSLIGGIHQPEAPPDPCDGFRCKRGKTCKLNADSKPVCVCQEPTQCLLSVNELDNVCGTDNKTYDTSCALFATKCNLEGTKRGHKLHLDYTGPCKLIPPCVDTELVQFPLRMRDWLKNVLLQLYEHDATSPGFLTPKQHYRVKKIFEGERRLHAGDHSVELLTQDFEKNYNMYIYPVHWQFAQLDQYPPDRFLSHSELAPLRVPLVPMEHCTSRFFQECDADKDKQVSLKEWISCFGIKHEDMDDNLLF